MATGAALTVAALRTELLFVPGRKKALGVGPRALGPLRRVLDQARPQAVVVVGYCAGLQGSLPPKSLVLADRAGKDGETVRVGAGHLAHAQELLPHAHVGPLIQVDRLLPVEEKARLGLQAMGADMESLLVAQELFRRGVPFLIARVVLDALWEELPHGPGQLGWAPRALACSRVLGRAVPLLRAALTGEK